MKVHFLGTNGEAVTDGGPGALKPEVKMPIYKPEVKREGHLDSTRISIPNRIDPINPNLHFHEYSGTFHPISANGNDQFRTTGSATRNQVEPEAAVNSGSSTGSGATNLAIIFGIGFLIIGTILLSGLFYFRSKRKIEITGSNKRSAKVEISNFGNKLSSIDSRRPLESKM